MRYATLLVLSSLLWVGCYTQVKSSGDYWGYSGPRHRRAVLVETDTTYAQAQPQQQPLDSTQQYSEGYDQEDGSQMIVNNYYEVSPWGHPYYYYWGTPAPTFGFSISVGNPWFYGPVYQPYYWDSWYWDSWYGYPYYGYSPYWSGWYPCIYPPFYPYYGFYRPYYGHGGYGHGGHGGYGGHGRTGRISGGEQRGGSVNQGGYNPASATGSRGSTGRASNPANSSTSPGGTGRGSGPGTAPTGRAGANQPSAPASTPRSNAPSQPNSGTQGRSGSSSTGNQNPRYYNALPRGARPPVASAQGYHSNGNYRFYTPRANTGNPGRPAPNSYRPSYGGGARSYAPSHSGGGRSGGGYSGGGRQSGGGSGNRSGGAGGRSRH